MWSKPKLFAIAAVLTGVLTGAQAHADLFTLYVQGQAGTGGTTNNEVMPGGEQPSIGNGLGVRAGAQVLFLEAYVDRESFFHAGDATRAILGFQGGLSLGPLHVMGRAGAGVASESDGGIDGNTAVGARAGFVARAGIAVEGNVAPHLALGLGLEDEYYRLSEGSNPMVDSDTHTGSDALGMLYLKVQFGL
jgi:hypothetical protein